MLGDQDVGSVKGSDVELVVFGEWDVDGSVEGLDVELVVLGEWDVGGSVEGLDVKLVVFGEWVFIVLKDWNLDVELVVLGWDVNVIVLRNGIFIW